MIVMIPISYPDITQAEKSAVLEVLDSGMLAQGPRTAKFEESFARAIGVQHAIAVSNGTTGLHIALLANGIGPGDEVITTPFTFIATSNAILFSGATPVFVDIEEDTYNIDPSLIEAAITPRTKAILPVHLYGHMCDMDRIQAIAQKYGLLVIEDACQAVMATQGGKAAGSFGTGVFSFYATKNLFCGEGGMITTNDDVVADHCRLLRNQGMKRRYHHEILGYNFRMTDLQAAIGLVQLERQPELLSKRAENADFFNSGITTVNKPIVRECNRHVWHQYTVRVGPELDRDEAVKRLSDAGIGTGIYYPVPGHQQPFMKEIIGEIYLPVAEKMATQVFSLPVHPRLTRADLERIVEEVNKL
jgi:dTDP-4-amino-4,6-dideoxygalactose transaminase